MAIQALPLAHGHSPSVESQPETLEDAFSRHITTLAALPIQTATQTDRGLLRSDGLDVRALRHLALRWCARASIRDCYGSEEVRGLALALADFSDSQFGSYVLGAASMVGPMAFV